jgi:hypothetical protein
MVPYVVPCVISAISRGRCVLVRRQGVPRGMRIGAEDARHDQRKRRHGCKQPHLPRFGQAAHRESLCLPRRNLMTAYLANIKTRALPVRGIAESVRYTVAWVSRFAFAACAECV